MASQTNKDPFDFEANIIFGSPEIEQGYTNKTAVRKASSLRDFTREFIGEDAFNAINKPEDTKTEEKKPEPIGVQESFRSVITESPVTQVAGGIRDAVSETLNIASDVSDFFKGVETKGIGDLIPEIPKTDKTANQILRSGSQFLTDFAPLMAGAKGLKFGIKGGQILKTELAAALAGAAAFDPEEPRLSNLINDLVPALKNPVTEFLASSPDDSAAEGRFKNALEGLGLGALTEGIFGAFKGIRSAKGLSKQVLKDTEGVKPKKIPLTKKDETGNTVLNTDAINTSEDLQKAIDSLSKLQKERFKAKRGVRSKEVTAKAARVLGTKIDDILKIEEGTALNAEQIIAVAEVVDNQYSKVIELAKKVLEGDTDAGTQLLKEADILGLVDPKFFGVRGESGRALEAQKLIQDTVGRLLRISESLTIQDENVTIEQFANMLLTQKSPKQMSGFMRVIKKIPNMIVEAWLSGLLTSIRTHEINILGNLSTTFISIPERLTASMFPGKGVQRQEAMDMVFGMVNSFRQGMRIFGKTLKTGVPTSEATKLEGRAFKKAISAEELGFDNVGVAGKAADLLGEFIRLPFRGLMASDDFFKYINTQAELYALARRTVRERGLSGDAASKAMLDIINDPPPQLSKMAEDFSAYQTFTNELGDIGKAVQTLANAHPSMRFVLPFIRTPVNIFKYSLERTPFTVIRKQFIQDMRAGGAKRDLALARLSLGSMALITFGSLADAGFISGSGPKNKNLRSMKMQSGWRPHSIKLGDKWVSYQRLDPVGMLIGIAADMNEAKHSLSIEEMDEMALAIALAFSRNMTSKTYLTGLRNALEMISLGSGDNIGSGTSAIKKFVGSFIPTILRDIEKGVDPSIREMDTWWKAVKANVPYFSQEVPLERNVFGEAIDLQGGLLGAVANPLYVSVKKDDPALDELINNEVVIGKVPSFIFGKRPSKFGRPDPDDGIELTEEQHDRYKVLAGEGLRESLDRLINSVGYENASPGAFGIKHNKLYNMVMRHREIAKKKLLKEFPELVEMITERSIRLKEIQAGFDALTN